MIAEAISILRDELTNYIISNKRSDDDNLVPQDIILENISNIESEEGPELSNKVVISLVNLQEETSLKNIPNVRRNPISGGFEYDRPPAHLNLFLLISSSPEINSPDAYELAIDRLSLVIEFFQAKNYFTIGNSPHSSVAQSLITSPDMGGVQGTTAALQIEEIKMYVDLYSLTFEQLNHLWGSLGGKQVPSALYKVRLVQVQSRAGIEAPLIENIVANSSPNT